MHITHFNQNHNAYFITPIPIWCPHVNIKILKCYDLTVISLLRFFHLKLYIFPSQRVQQVNKYLLSSSAKAIFPLPPCLLQFVCMLRREHTHSHDNAHIFFMVMFLDKKPFQYWLSPSSSSPFHLTNVKVHDKQHTLPLYLHNFPVVLFMLVPHFPKMDGPRWDTLLCILIAQFAQVSPHPTQPEEFHSPQQTWLKDQQPRSSHWSLAVLPFS